MTNPRKIKYSVRLKIFVVVITSIIFVSTIPGIFYVKKTKTGLINELEKRGISEAVNLAHDAQYGAITEDKVILDNLIAGRIKKPDISYIVITANTGSVLAGTWDNDLHLHNVEGLEIEIKKIDGFSDGKQNIKINEVIVKNLFSDKDEEFYEFITPIMSEYFEDAEEKDLAEDLMLFSKKPVSPKSVNDTIGFVKIGVSFGRINNEILETLIVSIIIIIIIITVLSIFASCYLTSLILKPISDVANTAKEIAKGDLSKQVEIQSMDEIGIMADNFNNMTSKLNDTIKELEQFKALLEKKVQQRTSDLESTNKKLKDANNELKTLDDMKNKFIYTVSHDFRTPLTAILGYAKVMRLSIQEEITDKLKHPDSGTVFGCQIMDEINDTQNGLNIIIKESERLTRLINSMLDLARLESGKFSWQEEKVNLLDISNLTKSSMRPLLKDKDLKFNIEVKNGSPVVFCDRDRLTQVFINLVSNAIKFSNNGGVINCLITKNCKKIEIKVKDTGMGIAPDALPYIFNKFSQADNGASNRHNGTGLGLTICREIISRFNGEIWVESELGKGSTFTFTIPVFDDSKAV